MEIKPVGYIYTDFKDKFGIPRQSGRAKSLVGRVVLESKYQNEEAIRGIEEFSHLWLIFGFSKAERQSESLTVRPPRLGGNARIGVFASRSPYRPNSLGISAVKLERIEKNENGETVIVVSGIDMLDKTPIYDIKPYLPYADCKTDAKGSYGEQMCGYSLVVNFDDKLLETIPEDKRDAVIECLRDDPRPSYHTDNRIYSMRFADFDIHFKVEENTLLVVGVDKI